MTKMIIRLQSRGLVTASAFASLVSGADVSGLGSGAALGSSTAGAACEPKKLTYKGSLGQEEERPPKQV